MPTTWNDIAAFVLGDGCDDPDKVDKFLVWARNVQRDVSAKLAGQVHHYYQQRATWQIIEGQNEYPIAGIAAPNQVLKILRVFDATACCQVEQMPDAIRDQCRASDEPGPPRYIDRFGDVLIVWPKPDAAYQLTVEFLRQAAVPTSLNDIVDVPDNYIEVVQKHTKGMWKAAADNWSVASNLFRLSGAEFDTQAELDSTPVVRETDLIHIGSKNRRDVYDVYDEGPPPTAILTAADWCETPAGVRRSGEYLSRDQT